MKHWIRIVGLLWLFTAAATLNSFGYSALCQSLPVSVSAGSLIVPLFTCNIPANAVAQAKSLRVTANLHFINGTVDSYIYFNGGDVTGEGNTPPVANNEQNWTFMVTNIGSTSFSIGGTSAIVSSIFAFGPQSVLHPSVPWSSGWTLQIKVASRNGP